MPRMLKAGADGFEIFWQPCNRQYDPRQYLDGKNSRVANMGLFACSIAANLRILAMLRDTAVKMAGQARFYPGFFSAFQHDMRQDDSIEIHTHNEQVNKYSNICICSGKTKI